MIERIVLCERDAEEAIVENIGAADRRAVAVHRGVWLPAIEIAGCVALGASAGSGGVR